MGTARHLSRALAAYAAWVLLQALSVGVVHAASAGWGPQEERAWLHGPLRLLLHLWVLPAAAPQREPRWDEPREGATAAGRRRRRSSSDEGVRWSRSMSDPGMSARSSESGGEQHPGSGVEHEGVEGDDGDVGEV
eukprot:gene13736-37000_t